MNSNTSRYTFFAAWHKMNTCTVLVLAKEACLILHHLVHFMGCWVQVNLLILSDMQALHTQRTSTDHSFTLYQTELGLFWMFDKRQHHNNRQYPPPIIPERRELLKWSGENEENAFPLIARYIVENKIIAVTSFFQYLTALTWGDQDWLYLISLQSVP